MIFNSYLLVTSLILWETRHRRKHHKEDTPPTGLPLTGSTNSKFPGYLQSYLQSSRATTGKDSGSKMSKQMEKHLFNLKFASKDLERNAKKSEKSEREEKGKLKKAIQKGNMDGARIHGENAIRNKNQALNYRRMSARVDAIAARVQTALTTKQVTGSMAGVVKAMESAMKSMNLEKVANLMDRFETQFENLDVQSQVMEDTMSASSTLNTPQGQVDSLMQEVADEAGLDLNLDLPSAQTTSIGASTQASQEQDDLSQRLAKLRH